MSSNRVKKFKEFSKLQMLTESTLAFANLLLVTEVVNVPYFKTLMQAGRVREATQYVLNVTNLILKERENKTGLVGPRGEKL